MAAEVISAQLVDWGTATNPAGQSITIPSDCTAVYVFGSVYINSGVSKPSGFTLNGNNASASHEFNATNPLPGAWVYAWYSPATGSQTLDIAFAAATSEGPLCTVVYVKGGDTTAWRTVGSDSKSGTTPPSLTLSGLTVGDLLLGYGTNGRGNSAIPISTAGWTTPTNGTQGPIRIENSRLEWKIADATSQAIPNGVIAGNQYGYNSCVGVAIPAGAGASAVAPLIATQFARRRV